MPVDTTFAPSTFEPEAVFTGCICPNVRQGWGVHEDSCPSQPHRYKKPETATEKWARIKKEKRRARAIRNGKVGSNTL